MNLTWNTYCAIWELHKYAQLYYSMPFHCVILCERKHNLCYFYHNILFDWFFFSPNYITCYISVIYICTRDYGNRNFLIKGVFYEKDIESLECVLTSLYVIRVFIVYFLVATAILWMWKEILFMKNIQETSVNADTQLISTFSRKTLFQLH